MPLARIDLVQGKPAEYRRTIGDVVYEAMVETLKAPKDDRFQLISEYAPEVTLPTRITSASSVPPTPCSSNSLSTRAALSNRRKRSTKPLPTASTRGWGCDAKTFSSTSSRSLKKIGRLATARPSMRRDRR